MKSSIQGIVWREERTSGLGDVWIYRMPCRKHGPFLRRLCRGYGNTVSGACASLIQVTCVSQLYLKVELVHLQAKRGTALLKCTSLAVGILNNGQNMPLASAQEYLAYEDK